jgi:hypothetical protein
MSDDLPDPTGTDWTQAEIELIVADYFQMVRLWLEGASFVKRRRNEQIRKLIGRSEKSIEYKWRNVSAVAELVGAPVLPGLAPARHFQTALVDAVEKWLETNGWPVSRDREARLIEASSVHPLIWTPPPKPIDKAPYKKAAVRRIARKFDAAAIGARNRDLGRRGEESVFKAERSSLTAQGRPDLASKVDWVSQSEGDGLGYDILSFDSNGKTRLLEVKTTNGWEGTPFFISENERALSEEQPEEFRLVRVYNFLDAPKAFEIHPPLDETLSLKATNYRASLL